MPEGLYLFKMRGRVGVGVCARACTRGFRGHRLGFPAFSSKKRKYYSSSVHGNFKIDADRPNLFPNARARTLRQRDLGPQGLLRAALELLDHPSDDAVLGVILRTLRDRRLVQLRGGPRYGLGHRDLYQHVAAAFGIRNILKSGKWGLGGVLPVSLAAICERVQA